MMPQNRFSLPGDDDGRLLEACDVLKISMYKNDEGEITTYFELHGSVGFKEDDEADGDCAFASKPDMQLVRDLLKRFEKVKD
jgi:hypothetical protein